MKIKSVNYFCIMFCLTLIQTSTSFGLIVDQVQDSQIIFADGVNENIWEFQTFQPAMNNLKQVDFMLARYTLPSGINFSFELRKDLEVLWSTSFSANLIPQGRGWFTIETPYIILIPDETYGLYLTSNITREQMDQGINIDWWGNNKNPYLRGYAGPWPGLNNCDFGFRTWAIPEPATILILAFGGMLLKSKKQI